MGSSKKWFTVLSLFLIVGLATRSAGAAAKTGTFWAALEGNHSQWNVLDTSRSGGSGYTSSGPWYSYASGPQQDGWGNINPVPTWLNQWYWDDPYDPTRWKVVTLNFKYSLDNPNAAGGSYIVINYTLPTWTDPTKPPMDNLHIGRVTVDNLWLVAGTLGVKTWSNSYDLRNFGINYNPEWISIDISGYNFLLSSPTEPGSLVHECVPEPATLALLALGGIGAVAGWRRRR